MAVPGANFGGKRVGANGLLLTNETASSKHNTMHHLPVTCWTMPSKTEATISCELSRLPEMHQKLITIYPVKESWVKEMSYTSVSLQNGSF